MPPPPPRKASHSKGLKGFTLAEVLITLSIIGVVAAMTIPTLLTKHQNQTYVTGLKKAYSTLSNAMQMLPLERGCPSGDYICAGLFSSDSSSSDPDTTIDDQTFSDSSYATAYLLSKVLKTKTICYDDYTKCTNAQYKSFLTSWMFNSNEGKSLIVLNDGILLGIHYNTIIYVDVNGSKGPNTSGRDIFEFEIVTSTKNDIPQGTLTPRGSALDKKWLNSNTSYWKDTNNCTTEKVNATSDYGLYCTGRVLEEGAMNY